MKERKRKKEQERTRKSKKERARGKVPQAQQPFLSGDSVVAQWCAVVKDEEGAVGFFFLFFSFPSLLLRSFRRDPASPPVSQH